MPQDIARSAATGVLIRSSDFVKARKPAVHATIASGVIYASQTRIGATGLRVGNMGLNLVDGTINRGMSTAAFKRVEAFLVQSVLPSANSFAGVAHHNVVQTVGAVRALPAGVKESTVRHVRHANTVVRRRVTAAKCSVTKAKVPRPSKKAPLFVLSP